MPFADEQAGYLAGYLSGLVEAQRSPRNGRRVISAIGARGRAPGEGSRRRIRSRRAPSASRRSRFSTDYSDEFVRQGPCERIANGQIDAGSDIVFTAAGTCGLGALAAVSVRGVSGIGADQDFSYLGPHVLASAIKRFDRAVVESVRWYIEGTLPPARRSYSPSTTTRSVWQSASRCHPPSAARWSSSPRSFVGGTTATRPDSRTCSGYASALPRTALVSLAALVLAGTVALAATAYPAARAPARADADDTLVNFDNVATGGPAGALTIVSSQYAAEGVTFNNVSAVDYSKGSFAIPGFAHSGTVAVEQCVGAEFCNTPLAATFAAPQQRVRVWVGFSNPLSQATQVQLRALDSSGALVGSASATLPANPAPTPIRTPLELDAGSASVSQIQVLIPGSFNNSLAVDDVEFSSAGPPPTCAATSVPSVHLDLPVDGAVVRVERLQPRGKLEHRRRADHRRHADGGGQDDADLEPLPRADRPGRRLVRARPVQRPPGAREAAGLRQRHELPRHGHRLGGRLLVHAHVGGDRVRRRLDLRGAEGRGRRLQEGHSRHGRRPDRPRRDRRPAHGGSELRPPPPRRRDPFGRPLADRRGRAPVHVPPAQDPAVHARPRLEHARHGAQAARLRPARDGQPRRRRDRRDPDRRLAGRRRRQQRDLRLAQRRRRGEQRAEQAQLDRSHPHLAGTTSTTTSPVPATATGS